LGDCKDKALDLIGRRPHFRLELQRKLVGRGFQPEEVGAVLEDLARLGMLDDLEHARDLAAGSMERKGFGPRRIRIELQRRGVDEAIAETVVAQAFEDPEEEFRRARETAMRRGIGGRADSDRLARHLDRKGYSKDVILRVLQDMETD